MLVDYSEEETRNRNRNRSMRRGITEFRNRSVSWEKDDDLRFEATNPFDQTVTVLTEPIATANRRFSKDDIIPSTFRITPSPTVQFHHENEMPINSHSRSHNHNSVNSHPYSMLPGQSEQKKLNVQHKERMRYPQHLSWRLDPDESLSDWVLTVTSNPELDDSDSDHDERDDDHDDDDGSVPGVRSKKYFVHRTRLAVGPRRSEYFANLFHHAKVNDSAVKGTHIELRPSAADAFPAMLDFIYSPEGTPVEITTESATALRHLATCFGIRDLFDAVSEFIREDMSPETSPIYLVEAQTFKYEKLMQMALVVCAEKFEEIKFSRLVHLTPDLFASVVSSEMLQCRSEVLSARVASYCRCRPGAIDLETLKILTDPSRMPEIAPEESLFYLRLISEADDDTSTIGGRSERIDGKDGLYQRCIQASKDIVRLAALDRVPSKGTTKTESRPKKNALKEYHILPNAIKVDLLERALAHAPTQTDLESLENERNELKRKQKAIAKKQIDFVEKEVEKLRRRYERKLAVYEAKIEAQEEELQAYTDELSRFIRVPNEHRVAPITSEYTFQSRPQFNEFGENLYGNKPPSMLPRFGHRGSEGWVLRQDEWRRDGRKSTKVWPVYYYKGNCH